MHTAEDLNYELKLVDQLCQNTRWKFCFPSRNLHHHLGNCCRLPAPSARTPRRTTTSATCRTSRRVKYIAGASAAFRAATAADPRCSRHAVEHCDFSPRTVQYTTVGVGWLVWVGRVAGRPTNKRTLQPANNTELRGILRRFARSYAEAAQRATTVDGVHSTYHKRGSDSSCCTRFRYCPTAPPRASTRRPCNRGRDAHHHHVHRPRCSTPPRRAAPPAVQVRASPLPFHFGSQYKV